LFAGTKFSKISKLPKNRENIWEQNFRKEKLKLGEHIAA
jgi:hypothetical protein